MENSGNPIVDKIGQMNFSGNIIPNTWFQTITEGGKPKLLAIMILADLVYWYRPSEVRDEKTGKLIRMKKKFRGEILQRGYADLSEQFGADKKTIQRNLNFLEDMGLIKRQFASIPGLSNIMYIEIFPEKIKEVTFPPEDSLENEGCGNVGYPSDSVDTDKGGYGQKCPDGMDTDEGGYGQKCPDGMDTDVHMHGQKCPDGMDKNDHTYTKNTTKSTTESNKSLSDIDAEINKTTCHVNSLIGYEALLNSGSEDDDCTPEMAEFDGVLKEVRDILVYEIFMAEDKTFNFGTKEEPDRKSLMIVKNVLEKNLNPSVVKSYIDQYLKNSKNVKRAIEYHIKGLYVQCLTKKTQYLSGGKSFYARKTN